jgi:methylmalonyl-CoA/ethylmalonyl-CoA epimerase
VILGIDHVGLATDDPAGVAPFLALLGLHHRDGGPAPAYGVTCDFWQSAAGGTAVELVTPVAADSVVGPHLATRGPGLYHLAFEVDDLEADVGSLRAAGFVALDDRPRCGARDGMTVAFLYLRKPAGLLVELVQYATTHHRKAGVTDVPR